MFRIKIDKEGDNQGTQTTCLVLNDKLSHTAKDIQVIFAIPYFRISMYAFYEADKAPANEDLVITRNRPFHVFIVNQISYPS